MSTGFSSGNVGGTRERYNKRRCFRLELVDLHVAVVVRMESAAPPPFSCRAFVTLASAGLVVIEGERKSAVHMTVTRVNVEVGGEVRGSEWRRSRRMSGWSRLR